MDQSIDDQSPEHDWREEADAVIKDVRDLVTDISVSAVLESNSKVIFLNLTTLEDNKYTIELSVLGFRVVSTAHDSTVATDPSHSLDQQYYDTPYALLSTLSPSYQERLSRCLAEKLDILVKQCE